MMMLALLLAGLLLAFAALAAFGLPYLVMGNRAFEDLGERRDLKVLAAGFGALAVIVVALPFAASGLISGAPQMQVSAETLPGVPHRFWS